MTDKQLAEIEQWLSTPTAGHVWGDTARLKTIITGLIAEVRRLNAAPDQIVETLCMTEWTAEDWSELDAVALPVESEGGEID